MKTNQFYLYLESRFYKDNHVRYHKYFQEWVENLTDNQLFYLTKDMDKSINQSCKNN